MAHPGLAWFCAECGYQRIEGQPHICKTSEERLTELQEAVGALLEAMPFDMSVCPKCRGNVLATKVCRFDPTIAGSWFACDEHATPGAMDSRTAPHVRRLRALLAG